MREIAKITTTLILLMGTSQPNSSARAIRLARSASIHASQQWAPAQHRKESTMSHFSRLPGRIVIPNRRHRRGPSAALLLASFIIAAALVALATLAGNFIR
jgi:hypothetical protein